MGGSPVGWWESSAEYTFIDRITLVVLMGAAVAFELSHHLLEYQATKKGHHFFTVKLWYRMNSEFMVLGFLAFVVWVCSRSGLLAAIVKPYETTDHMGPKTEADLLHALEDTHMRLFLAMCLYFLIVMQIAKRCEVQMREWSAVQEDVLHTIDPKRFSLNASAREWPTSATKREQFNTLRNTFQDHLIDNKARLCEIWGMESVQFDRAVERINFAGYLNYSMEKILVEFVHIKLRTWIGTALLALVIALTSGYSALSDSKELAKLVGIQYCSFFIILMTWLLMLYLYRALLSEENKLTENTTAQSVGRLGGETAAARVLQVAIFYGCYTIMYLVTAESVRSGVYANPEFYFPFFLFVYLLPFVLTMFGALPRLVPLFNIIFRMPPFLDKDEEAAVSKVMRGKFHRDYFPRLMASGTTTRPDKSCCAVLQGLSSSDFTSDSTSDSELGSGHPVTYLKENWKDEASQSEQTSSGAG